MTTEPEPPDHPPIGIPLHDLIALAAKFPTPAMPYKEVHAHSIDDLARLLRIERPDAADTMKRDDRFIHRLAGLPVMTAPQCPRDVVKLVCHDGTVHTLILSADTETVYVIKDVQLTDLVDTEPIIDVPPFDRRHD